MNIRQMIGAACLVLGAVAVYILFLARYDDPLSVLNQSSQNKTASEYLGILFFVWLPVSTVVKSLMIFNKRLKFINIGSYWIYAVMMGLAMMCGPGRGIGSFSIPETIAIFILIGAWPVADLLDSDIYIKLWQ
jgi:hypothetical protein